MKFNLKSIEQVKILPLIFKWVFFSILVGVLSGGASALFLVLLEHATNFRESHRWIIAFLPLAGLGVGMLYHLFGQNVVKGNNLILDEIHNPNRVVPKRMAPLIFIGTILTHLFGGSAGREGTAVQMGAALADRLTAPFRLAASDRRILLMAGMSAGFGSVFGTPLAGGFFGLEVLTIGRIKYEAILPCFAASAIANEVTLRLGVHHTNYVVTDIPHPTLMLILMTGVAGIFFGVVGNLFSFSVHKISSFLQKTMTWAPLRTFTGGVFVALGVWAFGTTKFIGLGIPEIVASLGVGVGTWDFLWKFLFTVVTLGAGFKGGEVTPLFYIGATLGCTLSRFLPIPQSTLSGLGFVAVFAGAANTPITCTLMAMELFGAPIGLFAAFTCLTSYLFSGKAGIYPSQRAAHFKNIISSD